MYKYHTNLSHLSPASSFFNVFHVLFYAAHSSFGHVLYLLIACGGLEGLVPFLGLHYTIVRINSQQVKVNIRKRNL